MKRYGKFTAAFFIIIMVMTGCVPANREPRLIQTPGTSQSLKPGTQGNLVKQVKQLIPKSEPKTIQKTAPMEEVEKANSETPNLAGGPEWAARTGNHSAPFPNVLFYSGPASPKQAALTFDDGPDIYFTTQILDILKQHNLKATFFIVGARAKAHPEMVKRIAAEGHAIGNHTWDHPVLPKLTREQLRNEITQTEQVLDSILGYHPAIFRPPYGSASTSNIREISSMGYKVIDWSVDTRDWAGTPVTQIMNFVRRELRPGGIILEHCAGGKGENLSNTVQALPEIISMLETQKYKVIRIPELLNIPAKMK